VLWSGSLNTGKPLLVFCIGPDRWLKAQAIARLKHACVAAGFEETDMTRFSDPALEPRAILEAIHTHPFGPGRRLVVIEGLEAIHQEQVPWLRGYLEKPNPNSCVTFCAEKEGAERQLLMGPLRGRPGEFFRVDCRPLEGSTLQSWIRDQAKERGKTIEPRAGVLLSTRLGGNLQSLAQAIESVSLLAGSSERISASDVEALVPASLRETAFEILDAAGAGRPEAALAALHQALATGKLTLEQFLGALGWYYRMIWKAKRGTVQGFWGSSSRKAALTRLTRSSYGTLEKGLEEVLQADRDLKTAAPHPELVADRLLLALAGQEA